MKADAPTVQFARCFLRLTNLPNFAVDRLSRYEATLWRQVARTLYALEILWIVVNPRSDPRVFGRINEARGWCKTSVVVAGNAAALIRGR